MLYSTNTGGISLGIRKLNLGGTSYSSHNIHRYVHSISPRSFLRILGLRPIHSWHFQHVQNPYFLIRRRNAHPPISPIHTAVGALYAKGISWLLEKEIRMREQLYTYNQTTDPYSKR